MEIEARYLKEQEVARITRRALSTLRNERSKGKGIPYFKIGRAVRYSLEDVVQWMESKRITTRNN